MKRRAFLGAGAALLLPRRPAARPPQASPWLLVPMDEGQADHLKAYGVAFRALERGERCEWLLNHRYGAFVLPASAAAGRDLALAGVSALPLDDGQLVEVRADIQQSNADAVPLEKAPKVAVYAPPNAAPWDDAVTMALNYAGIRFDKVWDGEVLAGRLAEYDWLHLHHEDFTGQYSKFYLNYAGSPWLTDMVERNQRMARERGFPHVPALKRAVAQAIAAYVEAGGFLFAMCTATETLDLALAGAETDLAAAFADGTPMDPGAGERMHWERAHAFQGARLEPSPSAAVFSDIDGHQVNSAAGRQPLGSFTLFSFSAKIDPVPTMLVQNHEQQIREFFGQTTAFQASLVKPSVQVLGENRQNGNVRYIYGELGRGHWTYYSGHDPESMPGRGRGGGTTNLDLFPHSPGYRLILNNVLFPSAKKKKQKT